MRRGSPFLTTYAISRCAFPGPAWETLQATIQWWLVAEFVLSFSNRCFPTKAVAVWLGTTDAQHVGLVRAYFQGAGDWVDVTEEDRSPGDDADPLYAVWARARSV
jgi:hypothetical protein